jgi:hypothetical protein
MATEILAVGDTAANSSDVTIDAGDSLTVCLKGTTSNEDGVSVFLKDDAGKYNYVFDLEVGGQRAVVISAAGTYRFRRDAGKTCGVFSA